MDKINKSVSLAKLYRVMVMSGTVKNYRELAVRLLSVPIATPKSTNDLENYSLDQAFMLRCSEFLSVRRNLISYFNFHLGKFAVFALPDQWLREMRISGLSRVLSNLMLHCIVLKKSVPRVATALYKVLWGTRGWRDHFATAAYVNDFVGSAPAVTQSDEKCYDFITWLRQNEFSPEALVAHSSAELANHCDTSIQYQSSPFPAPRLWSILLLVTDALWLGFLALLKFLVGKWKLLYMLDDILLTRHLRRIGGKRRFSHYYFLYQGTAYRPLWTEVLYQQGATITLVNYSASEDPTMNGEVQLGHLNGANWPRVIPFNDLFTSVLEGCVSKHSTVLSTPTVWLQDNGENVDWLRDTPTIALFSLAPLSLDKHSGYSAINDYVAHPNGNVMDFYSRFYNDVIDVAETLGCRIVFKPKRHDPRIDPVFSEMIRSLEDKRNLIRLNSELSPYKVVDNVLASVVQPFTSVAYYHEGDNAVCFYDPFSLLEKEHPSARGQPLYHGKAELKKWISKVV